MTLHLHRSNRLDQLVDVLASLDSGDASTLSPFTSETIVIQTRGLERWLGMELAKRRGVFANARFVSLEDYFADLCDALTPTLDQPDPWRPGRLAWPIAELLREADLAPPTESAATRMPNDPDDISGVRSWLGNNRRHDGDAMPPEVIELAWRIAEVFNRYTVYRPDMLAAWESDSAPLSLTATWQRALWRRLVARVAVPHPGRRLAALVDHLCKNPTRDDTRHSERSIPITEPRLVLLGHHTIAPVHLDALVALARHIDVHLFRIVVSPHSDGGAQPHPLRASLGRLGDELTTLLDARAPNAVIHDHLVAPAPTTLLTQLQSAIFHGTVPAGHAGPAPRASHLTRSDVAKEDDSLQFHSCSSELRQVEVLRDELLALFSNHPDLEPRDVIVMTPDIETYAPLVDAVFRDGDASLPDTDIRSAGFPPIHRLHDRSLRRTNPVAEAFLATLSLASVRHTLPQILDYITLAPVLAKAGLEEEDLAPIQTLLIEANIRWGDDEDHRASHDQPRLRKNTWRHGFDRLLLGHAIASLGLDTWQGIVPVDQVEGKEVERLGLFIDYVERLLTGLADLAAPRTIPEWRLALTHLTEQLLISDDESAGQAQPIFDELASLADRATHGGFTGRLDFLAVVALLIPPFEARRPSVSFLSGGLTFCTLVPMRTIPFRVVALLGMDGGTFPRSSHGLGFDLLETDRRPGDRTPRDDDRMTMLETIVAARSHLIVTWTGQRATDSRALDAAGPVAELMEVVRLSLASPSTLPPDTLAPPILTRHPLQPFTPSNFLVSHPLSFDLRYLSGARRITAERMPLPVHWPADASRPTELPTRTTLDDLTLAIAKPADWFCQRRLNVRLGRFETVLHEREPIALDALERWQLRDRVLAWEVANVPVADRERALIASGDLPIGAAEKLALSDIEDAVKLIVDRVRSLVTDAPTSVPIALTLDGLDLVGVIDHVHHIDRPGSTAVRVLYKAGRLKDPDVIALWVEHLVLTTVLRRPVQSHLVAHDGHVSFAAEGQSVARDLLRSLVSAWLRGHLAPLPFFARTARAYYDWLHGAPLDAEVPSTVRDAWHKKRARFEGECDAQDASIQLLFGDRLDDPTFPFADPLFLELTHTIVAPLHQRFELLPLA